MNRFVNISNPLTWFMALLLAVFVAGCSGGSSTAPLSSAKAITAFSFVGFPGNAGVIIEGTTPKTIAVTVPFGTNLTNPLTATFTTSAGASVKIGTEVQTSGTTANNFTNVKTYIVTAADGTTATYSVIVTVASATAKAITAYSFVGFSGNAGVIDEAAKTIAVTLPIGTPVTALVANFTTTGVNVKIGTATQVSYATQNNFTSPVAYIVTDGNAATVTYTVTVNFAASSAKAITAFSFVGFPLNPGVINDVTTPKTIAVTLPFGTDVTALVATFTHTGASVKIGTATQVSGTTSNTFTSAKDYTVTAANGTTAIYTVTVTVAASSAKAITAFSFAGFTGNAGVITGAASPFAIAVTLPNGTPVTALVANFTTTGASVKIGTTVQTSGATSNDFTTAKAYIVTAADNSTAVYDVTVTVAAPVVQNPTAPNLGEAGRFVILASQLVTNVPTSDIRNGDIGVLDQARTFIQGFTATGPAGDLTELTNGTSYASDDANPSPFPAPLKFATPVIGSAWATTGAMITQVRTDLGVANTFLGAANATAPDQILPIQLGNLSLTPGVYRVASPVQITTGALQLNAQGNANAVWIFDIAGTLTTGAPGGNITFVGGVGQAKNVFWRTSGTTTIGAGNSFIGNVFAATEINLLAGATVTGRLFGITDQVTLISNIVTKAP